MKQTIVTHSFEETRRIGYDFAKKMHGGEVLALYGDLGSGKTTFTQGLAHGLGIERNVISPTFIIMRSYEIKGKAERVKGEVKWFYHVDLYRIGDEREVEDLGLLELMGDPENIVVIEWPEKIENLLPDNRIDLVFEYLEGDERKIILDR